MVLAWHSPEWDPILWEELRGSASHSQESKATPLLCQAHVSLLFPFDLFLSVLHFTFFLLFFYMACFREAPAAAWSSWPCNRASARIPASGSRQSWVFFAQNVAAALVFLSLKRFSRASASVRSRSSRDTWPMQRVCLHQKCKSRNDRQKEIKINKHLILVDAFSGSKHLTGATHSARHIQSVLSNRSRWERAAALWKPALLLVQCA